MKVNLEFLGNNKMKCFEEKTFATRGRLPCAACSPRWDLGRCSAGHDLVEGQTASNLVVMPSNLKKVQRCCSDVKKSDLSLWMTD